MEERLPLADKSIGTVMTTWTLCSMTDEALALRQMRRVLKPRGLLVFIEHGRAPEKSVAKWQDRLTPFWKKLAGGCHLNRKIEGMITKARFRITDLKTFYQPGPRAMTYTYQGLAEP